MSRIRNPSAETLLKLEEELNDIKYREVGIGGIYSRLLFIFNRNDHRTQDLNNSYAWILIIFKSIKNHLTKKFPAKRVLLAYTSPRNNFKNLLYKQKEYFPNDYCLYGPDLKGNKKLKGFNFDQIPCVGFFACFKILIFCVFNFNKIQDKFHKYNVHVGALNIFNYCYIQLLKFESFYRILPSYKIVLVDYDRSFPLSPLILASKSLGIKTISLIHGNINPIYGYQPFIAEEIWCWGEFQKKQLLKLGIQEEKLKIVGNPSISNIKGVEIRKPTSTFTIGVILDRHNKSFIEFINDAFSSQPNNKIKILFKPHPMMQPYEFKHEWVNNSFKSSVYQNPENNNIDFFDCCDLVISKGSTMCYEAILNNTPVVLINIEDGTGVQKNLYLMNKEFSMPIFEATDKFRKYINGILNNNKEYNQLLLTKQKKLILTKFYYKTGENASLEVKNKIQENLKNL